MPTFTPGQKASTSNIAQRLRELEAEHRGAVQTLHEAQGQEARLLRTHVVYLARQIRWYRGRAEGLVSGEVWNSRSARRAKAQPAIQDLTS